MQRPFLLSPVTKNSQTRVVDGAGKTLRYIEDPRVVRAGIESGKYKLLDKRGAFSRCVRDLTHAASRQTAALASVYQIDSASFIQKRAVGNREDYTLQKWGAIA